ncbi:MAG: type II toxin-antitoxin system VapC family toxin [Clostridiales bacterium]|nr:type II toxin-antitoxin system VapC family toxin [Clostridiales bacterium]
MNLLLDTHILIWALNDDARLPKKAKEMILDPENAVYYSSISIWEVSIKHMLHPENVTFSGEELSGYCQEAGYIQVEMRDRHVYALETLKREKGAPDHSDPFDRILIAQAKTENLTFLTHDALLPFYGEKCVALV